MTPTRPRSLLVVLLALAALGLAACGSGDGAAEAQADEGIRITDATIDWPANPEVAALRMRVHNDGTTADELRTAAAEAPADVDAQLGVADLDLSGGHVEDAFDRLLSLFPKLDAAGKEAVRARILDYFEIVGVEDPRVGKARARLASLLY